MAYQEDKSAQARALLGKRVEIPVHYDMWMQGARFGTVTQVRSDHVMVKMDHPQVKRRLKVWRLDYDYLKVIA